MVVGSIHATIATIKFEMTKRTGKADPIFLKKVPSRRSPLRVRALERPKRARRGSLRGSRAPQGILHQSRKSRSGDFKIFKILGNKCVAFELFVDSGGNN